MANIAVLSPTEAWASGAFSASTPSGDALTGVETNNDLILEVDNGHTTNVTVTIAPAAAYATPNSKEYGQVAKAGITAVVPTGVQRIAVIPAGLVRLYQATGGVIPIAYTGGNAALLVRAMQRA